VLVSKDFLKANAQVALNGLSEISNEVDSRRTIASSHEKLGRAASGRSSQKQCNHIQDRGS
jgi:hypothetical protein